MEIPTADALYSQINMNITPSAMNQTDVDKALISFVKKNIPIWDRNSNTYPNKQLKNQLWDNISIELNLETNACMLRWKSLREKYIRQKIKFQHEGEKWELLDELSFLDKVIQYRKKQTDDTYYLKMNPENTQNSFLPRNRPQQPVRQLQPESDSNFSQTLSYNCETGDESSLNESSSDFSVNIKAEKKVIEVADSSYYSSNQRRRTMSTNSETSTEKKQKLDDMQNLKAPEVLFGDLVAAMLARKPEKDRNLCMIEIMKVLSK